MGKPRWPEGGFSFELACLHSHFLPPPLVEQVFPWFSFYLFIYFFVFCLFRAKPMAYGDSQAKGLIGAVAAGLRQSRRGRILIQNDW